MLPPPATPIPHQPAALVTTLQRTERTWLRDDVTARIDLVRLAPKTPGPAPQAGRPAPAQRLLSWYRAAQRRFGLRGLAET